MLASHSARWKPARDQRIHPRQVLLAHEFQRISHLLEENGAIEL